MSRRRELAWATHTRPDLSATVAILAKVTRKQMVRGHLWSLNKGIKLSQDYKVSGMIQYKLPIDSLKLVIYTDSSFPNFPGSATQLGFIIVLTDERHRGNVLYYSRYKFKRVVRSVLGGEVCAFAGGFDMAISLKH